MSARKWAYVMSDKAHLIPLDSPGEEGASKQGFYLEPLGLPWLIEDLGLSIKGSRALVAALCAAHTVGGSDVLLADYWEAALSTIEDQLSRSAAIADHAVRLLLAEGGAS